MEKDPTFGPTPDDPNNDNPRPKRPPRQKQKKGEVVTIEECTNKVFQLYTLTGKLLKTSPGKRKEKDFIEEGAALARLAEKYAVIAMVLRLLDPVFFILSAFDKFNDHFAEHGIRRREKKERERQEKEGVAGLVITNGEQSYNNASTYHAS